MATPQREVSTGNSVNPVSVKCNDSGCATHRQAMDIHGYDMRDGNTDCPTCKHAGRRGRLIEQPRSWF